MPVSGNEEVGVKPSVGQFSEYTAGIPIKKRRFPFILSPSQLAENLPLLPTENELERKGFSSPLRGLTVSTDTIIAVSSDPTDVLLSSHTSGVLSSSKTNVIKADGSTASLDTGSFVATSNASSVATSSTSVATSSNASGAAMNSTTISAAAGSVATSSSAAISSTSSGVAAGLNADGVAECFNASSVAMGSTAISVSAGSIASVAVENPTASSVAGSVLASVLSYSEASAKSVLEKEKSASDDTNGSMVQCNTNLLSVKVEEQSFTVQPGSLVDINRKGKLMATGASKNTPRTSAKPELDLVGNDSLTFNIGKDTNSQKNVDGTIGSQLPEVPGNPGLSLGLGEYLSATASGNNEQGFRNQEKEESVSLNLSLSKVDCIAELRTTEVHPNTKGANMLANRTNWDLNTTMDSWEGPGGDNGTSKMTNHMDDMKPVICSAGMAAASMPAQQQMREEIERRAKIEMLPVPSSQQYRSEDSLCLGLTTPHLHLRPDEILSGSSAKVANISSPRKPVPACKSNMVNYKPVKSEPHDESTRGASAGISKPTVLSNITQVKSEKNEKLSSETLKSSTLSTLNSVDSVSVKPEPVCESNKKSQEIMDGQMNQSDEQMLANETEPIDDGHVASKIIYCNGLDVNESNISGTLDNSINHSTKVEDPDHCRLKSMDVQLPDSRGLVEGSVSEEKINLSGDVLEEDSYGSDYELDDGQELAAVVGIDHDRREDDFEDGEVREPVENPGTEVCEKNETGNGNNGDTAFKDIVDPSSFSFGEKDLREDPGLTGNDNTNECIDTSVYKDLTTEADKKVFMQEPSAVEMPSSQVDKTRPIKALPRKLPDVSEKDTVKGQEGEQTSIQFSDTSQGTSVTIAQGADAARSSEGKIKSILPKLEEFSNVDDAGKDVDNGGRSRIINLSRASNLSSPGRTRSISGRALQSQVGRERLPDVALEGDKLHPRGRDEAYADSSHRFPRERYHVHPSRNNRMNFMRGRDLNFSGYNNRQDAAYFGTGRGGRKILNDDSSIFPQLPPRRRSPGGRDGPEVRGLQMVRRIQRNLSPSRCIGEDGSDIVGLRHMRGFADDHTNPMFAHCQPSFEGLDDPFVRGDREFTSVQRRDLQQTCSKSPTRPRTRSPGPWSSLRRRLPDGFGGPLELPHQRSSPIYRMERIRSPDHPCFNGDMGIRRHESPSYLSRPSKDLRDIDPDQDHGHPRSGISNRSPSGRILLRNRRLDLDPRERNDGDDYFGGPMQSGRFQEIGNDGNSEERRRYGDRRGPVRPFRPSYSVADSENFHLNTEGGVRSFRFCPEDDSELHERGKVREREFDRRIKKRPGNAPPRRTQNIEEHEGNFRHGGQIWQDDGFEDMSQVKRKRF
ncbi:uncharacterized protein LOC120175737 isoform X1 [Hibiscus syriacus]|uniref:uncharacterized protein LOC120175737 isoform X1 n=1 Tax=Hibiscus syriacus TaxID=106335 RepID=UPI001921D643|nr:uncharacterized protein LOC120175737 isoform X1 [Hibiscus syriacus]